VPGGDSPARGCRLGVCPAEEGGAPAIGPQCRKPGRETSTATPSLPPDTSSDRVHVARGWGCPGRAPSPAPCPGVHPPASPRQTAPSRILVPARPARGGSHSKTSSCDPHRGTRSSGCKPPQHRPGALAKETGERCCLQRGPRSPTLSPFAVSPKDGEQPARSSEVTATASARGEGGPAPTWPGRQTGTGHRVRSLHGTGALLPAAAGTGQFLLHGISKAGRRAGHRGEVGKSWCVWQDFSRGFVAAGERGSRRGKGKARTERRGEEREKKQKSFGARLLQTLHPAQATGSRSLRQPPGRASRLLPAPPLPPDPMAGPQSRDPGSRQLPPARVEPGSWSPRESKPGCWEGSSRAAGGCAGSRPTWQTLSCCSGTRWLRQDALPAAASRQRHSEGHKTDPDVARCIGPSPRAAAAAARRERAARWDPRGGSRSPADPKTHRIPLALPATEATSGGV